jgi:hypothetical protein
VRRICGHGRNVACWPAAQGGHASRGGLPGRWPHLGYARARGSHGGRGWSGARQGRQATHRARRQFGEDLVGTSSVVAAARPLAASKIRGRPGGFLGPASVAGAVASEQRRWANAHARWAGAAAGARARCLRHAGARCWAGLRAAAWARRGMGWGSSARSWLGLGSWVVGASWACASAPAGPSGWAGDGLRARTWAACGLLRLGHKRLAGGALGVGRPGKSRAGPEGEEGRVGRGGGALVGWAGPWEGLREAFSPFVFFFFYFFTINELHADWIHTKAKHHTKTNIFLHDASIIIPLGFYLTRLSHRYKTK